MRVRLVWALLGVVLVGSLGVGASGRDPLPQGGRAGKKVVFIAGTKSHGPGDHEYEKGCRLLAKSLEQSPDLKGWRTEVHLYGWPEDPKTLDDADAIVLYCDGSDHGEQNHPLLTGDRLAILEKQKKRGAGIVALHYTVFVPTEHGGAEFLDWLGGYFDYETGDAPNHWYSKIQTCEATVTLPTPTHPASSGLKPFPLHEEFYYNMRFREKDTRRTPLLNVVIPGESTPQTVAWAVDRADSGRGFTYTGGHFHNNWRENEGLRTLILNGIVWSAKGTVPKNGVRVATLPDTDGIRALMITGHHHPAHDWRATTDVLKTSLPRDSRISLDIWEDPEKLAGADLSRYDLLIQNYCNWESPSLSEKARQTLFSYVENGGGLVLVHFANGAWRDWPDYYKRLSRRVWVDNTSGHDAYGTFTVRLSDVSHRITQGIAPFETVDELYYRQVGDLPVTPLLVAQSKDTKQDEPLAFVYEEGKGRVFQCLLGHSADSLKTPAVAEMMRRAVAWTARREVLPQPVEAVPAVPQPPPIAAPKSTGRTVEGKFDKGFDARSGVVAASGKAIYQEPPLTVECWARLFGKSGFNILVANSHKDSRRHWELYTVVGSGKLAAYIPGAQPQNVESDVDIVDGQWHHCAMTFLPGEVKLFVDGKLVKTAEISLTNSPATVGPIWFGGYPPQNIGCDGFVDEVRLSRTVRPINGLPTAPPALDEETIGLWRFDSWENDRSPDLSSQANPARPENSIVAAIPPTPQPEKPAAPLPKIDRRNSTDWVSVGNDKGGMRYSPLNQINKGNVANLKVAWTYRSGDAQGTTIECTPIVVEGVMYITSPRINIIALDAATGKEIWKFDPKAGGVNRGVAYWSDGKNNGQRRIVAALADGRLLSLDARTGKLDPAFGLNGTVDMKTGFDRDIRSFNYGSTSPPMIFENHVIIPIINSEGQPGAPGDIRSFDIRTGKELWKFRTVPAPGEFGNDTWDGKSWKERSGANPWAGFTLDEKRGILFAGVGSAASDFYGGDRTGANLFANCTLALDARTGKRLWHFQTLHHDLWDHDLPCPPVVAKAKRNGKTVDVVAQPTKTGQLFVFDRVTGQPIFPIEERPVPKSDVPGETAYPTQPFPTLPPPFSRQTITENDLTDLDPEAAAEIRERFKKLRGGPIYTPPTREGTIMMPGFHGGANWSGASFDPTTNILYVNSCNVPNVTTLVEKGDGFDHTGYFRFLDKNGYPGIKPPWGLLTAIDLNTGQFVWQVVLGEYPELRAKGIPPTGTENFGGTIVTAGGLVFIAGTKDEKFRAFDKATGKIVWEYQLPAGGYATPSTYRVNGKQYIVIAAGGGGKLGTKSGDYFIAFALR